MPCNCTAIPDQLRASRLTVLDRIIQFILYSNIYESLQKELSWHMANPSHREEDNAYDLPSQPI